MYKCNVCGREFDRFKTTVENGGEKWYRCPFCGETDFDEHKIVLTVEKDKVADTMLSAIAKLNSFRYSWRVGKSIIEFETALGILTDYVIGMIDTDSDEFVDKLNEITTQDEADELLKMFVEELQ